MFWPPDSPWALGGGQTKKNTARAMCLMQKSEKMILFRFRMRRRRGLSVAAKNSELKGVGIEIDPLRYLFPGLDSRLTVVARR